MTEHHHLDFPVGSDLVEFFTDGEKTYLHCLVCGVGLPDDVTYLNQAILVWNGHVEDQRKKHGLTGPINVYSVPDDPTIGAHFLCNQCGHREMWGTLEDAGCASTWHVYEQHREHWIELFGDRPPKDRDPRLDPTAVALRPGSTIIGDES